MCAYIAQRFLGPVLAVFLLFFPNAVHARSMDSADTGLQIVTTQHTIAIDGTRIHYTARAGFIPLLDKTTNEVHAEIFFVSYSVNPKRGSPARPLTFYTNGGPPEPATLVALGPRSLKGLEVERRMPPPSYQLVDNQKTWLTFTDLVLIDPVGTGYSRATKSEYAAQYYNVDGDAESIAQFILGYIQRYDPAKRQPIFVAGWSYGSVRSALTAGIAKRYGFAPRGLMLLASALGNQPRHGNTLVVSDLGYIQQLPTMTATAFFHKKLAPDLQRNFEETLAQSEAWATHRYPKFLAQTDHLPQDQQQAAAVEMAWLTGLSPEVILKHHFRVMQDEFLRELLGADWTPLGLKDSRLRNNDMAASWMFNDWYPVGSTRYLRGELHFTSEIPYADGAGIAGAVAGWYCGTSPANDCYGPATMDVIETAPQRALAGLQQAMRDNPSLRVLMASGYYDFNCPYFGINMALSQFAQDLRARITVKYFHTGHFLLPEVRPAVAGFISFAP